MVAFYGDYDTTETVIIPFNTFSSDDPSASVTITNLVTADVEIHKDGSVTQRTSDNGVAVTIDFDTVTGNHIVSIDLSDNSDAGFYANGSRYQVRMEGTTIDGATINAWIGSFSIGCTLRPTTDGRKLDVTATGAAGIDWGNVENPTTAVDLSATDIQLCDTTTTNTDMVSEPPTAAAIVNEWETQSQADPTGFHVNVMEWLSQACATPTVNGVPEVDLTHLMGTILTEGGAGRLAAAFIKLLDVAAPLLVASDVMRGTDGANTTVPDAAGIAPTASEIQAEMEDNGASILDTISDKLPTNNIMGSSVKTDKDDEIDAIKAKTDNLPADPASETNVDANETKIDVVIGHVDEVEGILQNGVYGVDIYGDAAYGRGISKVGFKLASDGTDLVAASSGDVKVIKDKTDNLPTDPASETNVDANETKIDALNDLSAAEVNTQVDAAIETYHLDHLLATDYDPAAKPGVATALLNELVESDGGVSRYTANALEQAPTAPTAAQVADAVLQESIDDHKAVAASLAEHIDAVQVLAAGLNDISVADILAGTVDVLDLQDTLKRILAFCGGNMSWDGSDAVYKEQDGVTTEMTMTVAGANRTVS